MHKLDSRVVTMIASLSFLIPVAASSAANAHADDAWKMRIPAHAQIGSAPIEQAAFEFACTSGKGGAVSLTVVLPAPETLKAFPLDDFEGPGAIGETHKLAEWSVSGSKQPARARTPISGWRGVDGDGFLLSTARESSRPSDIARLAKRLLASDQARLRLVVKPLKKAEALKVEGAIAGHREAIEKILAPCLKAVK